MTFEEFCKLYGLNPAAAKRLSDGGYTTRVQCDSTRADTWDTATNSIDAVVCTATPATVYDWKSGKLIREIMLMDGVSFDPHIPALDSHQRTELDDAIGVWSQLRMEDGQYVGRCTFGTDEKSQRCADKYRDGILRAFSIGYTVTEAETIPKGQAGHVLGVKYDAPPDMALRIAIRSRVTEISGVIKGADPLALARAEQCNIPVGAGQTPKQRGKRIMPEWMKRLISAIALSRGVSEEVVVEEIRAADAEGAGTKSDAVKSVKPVDEAAARAAGIEQERARVAAITELATLDSTLPEDTAQKAVADGITEAAFRQLMLEHKRAATKPPVPTSVVVGADLSGQRLADSMTAGLVMKASALHGMSGLKPVALAPDPATRTAYADTDEETAGRLMAAGHRYSRLTTDGLARAYCREKGIAHGDDPGSATRAALSVNEFSGIFLGMINTIVINRLPLLIGSTKTWVPRIPLKNMQPAPITGLTNVSSFRERPRGGAAKPVSVSDTTEWFTPHEFTGEQFIDINDYTDDFFGQLAQIGVALAQGGAQTPEDSIYATLLSNPTMADGNRLFSVAHGNYATTGSVLSTGTVATAAQTMWDLREKNRALTINPKYFLFPPALYFAGKRILNSQEVFSSEGTLAYFVNEGYMPLQDTRVGTGGVIDPQTEALITGSNTAWYVFSESNMASPMGLVLGLVDGTEFPIITTKVEQGPRFGIAYFGRLRYAVGVARHQGCYMATGASS